MSEALLLDGVWKRYGDFVAVRDLSLAVPPGTIYGILGPNGAGKSTTLRVVMNILGRDAGRVLLLGEDPEANRDVLRRVGYLPEERGLYKKMKVIEVVVFFAALKGIGEAEARRRGEEWLERMGLAEWRDAKIQALSKGMQQKVQFITTVLHEPEVLILDEPQAGLDPVNQEVLRDTMLEASRRGRTVIFSTHNMEQAEQLCEHICIIARGQKVLDGGLREVRRAHRGNRYLIEFDAETEESRAFLERSPQLGRTESTPRGWVVELAARGDAAAVLEELGGLETPVRRFEHIEPSLHEIFVSLVGEDARTPRREEPVHA